MRATFRKLPGYSSESEPGDRYLNAAQIASLTAEAICEKSRRRRGHC
jgi:hypothetical protein